MDVRLGCGSVGNGGSRLRPGGGGGERKKADAAMEAERIGRREIGSGFVIFCDVSRVLLASLIGSQEVGNSV